MVRPPLALTSPLLFLLSASGCGFNSTVDLEATDLPSPGPDAGDEVDAPVNAIDASASPELCGNGLLDSGEACDDGNVAAADGCSPSCSIEDGYLCSGPTGDCVQVERLEVTEPFELIGLAVSMGANDLQAVRCEDDLVLIGMRGYLSDDSHLIGVRGLCVEPLMSDGGALDWKEGDPTETVGVETTTSEDALCDSDQLMVGVVIDVMGSFVTGLRPVCAPVSVALGELHFGDLEKASQVGEPGDTAHEAPCGDGRAAAQALAAYSSTEAQGRLRGFAFQCGLVRAVSGAD